jgi:cobalt transporter subunit CbtA
MFAAIAWRALIVGLLAGIVLTAVQTVQVAPLIVQAEAYEQAAPATPAEAEEWAPQDGIERTFYTGLSNVLAAIGFALVLLSFIALQNQGGWKRGLLWGLAGFTVFFAAPTLSGLHPELPGTVAASLDARQIWWWTAVVSTAAGLWLLVFAGQLPWRGLGLLLLASPYILGAPQPEVAASLAPEALSHAFLPATAIANVVFWLVLGLAAGAVWKQSPPEATRPAS